MITDITFYILAALAVLIIGISKSGFGSGLAVLGVPLMAIAISPAKAAAPCRDRNHGCANCTPDAPRPPESA